MLQKLKHIVKNLSDFHMENSYLPDIDKKLYLFIYSELYKFFNDENINNLHDWLNKFDDDFDFIAELAETYFKKVFNNESHLVNLEEQFLMYAPVVLYAKELDIEIKHEDNIIKGMAINRFIEILKNYDLCRRGHLKVKGVIMVSDLSKFEFYSIDNAGSVRKELPITL